MRKRKWEKLVFTSMFTALTCIATLVIQIPSPMNGYLNLGDALVLLGAWFLGPAYGAFAGGVGSMLADLLSGYAYYAPGTLVIKALVALVAALVFQALRNKVGEKGPAQIISGILGECIMIAGYFGYACLLLQKGLAAAASIPGNLVQGGVGIVAATVVYLALRQVAHLPELLRGN